MGRSSANCLAARFCRAKAIEPSAELKWEDAEEALKLATPNDMHRFLNWCCKLEYNPNSGRRQKRYKKASAFNADWKYFRIYYTRVTKHEMSEEMGEAVRTVSLVSSFDLRSIPF